MNSFLIIPQNVNWIGFSQATTSAQHPTIIMQWTDPGHMKGLGPYLEAEPDAVGLDEL